MTDFTDRAERMQSMILARGLEFERTLVTTVVEETVAGQFVRDVLSADELSEEQRMRVLVTGLRALDGSADLRVAWRRDDQDFSAHHRPWKGGKSWEVGALVALDDGRRVELRQDLDGGESAAVDASGKDVSDEIANEGNPDASRWFGLDRRSFRATACVRQAEVLEVLADAELLQAHLQRAAAGAGNGQTAALALNRITEFERDQVGQDRSNSTKPLRRARQRVDSAGLAREKMLLDRQHLATLIARADEAAARATELSSQLARAEANVATRELQELERRLLRARELETRFGGKPHTSRSHDDDLARSVINAVQAWTSRPAIPELPEPGIDELARQLAAVPAVPEGDLEPDGAVLSAKASLDRAQLSLELHAATRPGNLVAPFSDTSESELRALADVLSADAGHESTRAQPGTNTRTARLSARQLRSLAIVGSLVAGVVAMVLGSPWLGVPLVLTGVFIWFLTRVREERPVPANASPASPAVRDVRQRAYLRVEALGVSDDPTELRALADQFVTYSQGQEALARWSEKGGELRAAVQAAERTLIDSLRARGLAEGIGVEDYVRACQERSRTSALAARRPGLEERIAYRREAERSAATAADASSRASTMLRDAAASCGLPAAPPDELAGRLAKWLEERRKELADRDAAEREWTELQVLLDGRRLVDLEAELEQRQNVVSRLSAALDGPTPTRTAAPNDTELPALRAAAADAAQEAAAFKAEAQTVERSLPRAADIDVELVAAGAELEEVENLAQTLGLTREFLERAQDRVHVSMAPVLQKTLDQWLPRVTQGRYVASLVDPQTLKVRIRSIDGPWRDAQLLSHGTAEQAYLLLRLAITDHLTAGRESCPVILDDVVVQSDSDRTRTLLELLHEISRMRQVVLFTLSEQAASWAEQRLHGPRDRFERLDRVDIPA